MSRFALFPAIALLFLCPVYAQQNAVLRSKGTVKVNGSPAGTSTVVMEGDRIETDKHSSASLLLPGRMISLGSASSVVYHDGNVVPSVGAAKVTTATCHGSSCTTSSAMLGSANANAQNDEKDKDDKDKDKDKDKDPKKKCVSPKKPHKDKDCDADDNDHDNGHGDDHHGRD
jgi:hypothetical protein